MSRLLVAAALVACNASAQQVGTTITSGVEAGVCITVALATGADPLACAGVTEQTVVDVINDVESKQSDAAQPAVAPARLSSERARMKARLMERGER